MHDNYPRALANTLVEEGGYVDNPNDPGGPTMRGVIQKTYDDYRRKKGQPTRHVKQITETELQDIYRTGYADLVRFDDWPKGPDQVVFDIAVNSGPSRGWSLAASVLGTPATAGPVLVAAAKWKPDELVRKLCARRGSFYKSLSTFSHFGKGWMRRNARMEALGVKMALEASSLPRGDISEDLQVESDKAHKEASKAAKGATGSGTAASGTGAGSATVVEQWDWLTSLGTGAAVLALIALTLFFIWLYRRHKARAKMYQLVAVNAGEVKLPDVIYVLKQVE